MNGNAKWVQWVLGILIMIAMAVSSYAVNKLDDKVGKDDFNCSVLSLQTDMREMRNDIKELLRRDRREER